MRPGPLAALALSLAACAPGAPYVPDRMPEDRPRPRRTTRFKVATASAPMRVRHDLSRAEIAELPGAKGSRLKTQGLTLVKRSLATHTRFSTSNDERTVRAWFDDVIVTLSVASITIFIPKEYAKGSCEYKAVLEHERGHGRIAMERAAVAAKRLEDALAHAKDLPERAAPIEADSHDAAAKALQEKVQSVLGPVYDRFEDDLEAAQASHDRPDPYDEVYRRCKDWL